MRTYGKYKPLRSTTVFGGVSINPQIQELRRGVDIVVATPGPPARSRAAEDHRPAPRRDPGARRGRPHARHGLHPRHPPHPQPAARSSARTCCSRRPSRTRSASSPAPSCTTPPAVEVARRNTPAELISQVRTRWTRRARRELLAHLVKTNNWQQVLVFTRTKHGANRLAEQLEKDGIEADAIHGNKSQPQRTRALKRFKDNELQVLVATDIAARGIDIDELPHVVNYDLPHVSEDYVHRIGRTGRAGVVGRGGVAGLRRRPPAVAAIERLMNAQGRAARHRGLRARQPLHQQPRSPSSSAGAARSSSSARSSTSGRSTTTSAAPRATRTRRIRARSRRHNARARRRTRRDHPAGRPAPRRRRRAPSRPTSSAGRCRRSSAARGASRRKLALAGLCRVH